MVTMSSKLTFGTTTADWQERINVERLRQQRTERARQMMRRHELPAILAAGAANTRYLTSVIGPEFEAQLWYVLFFAEHDPVVFTSAGWLDRMPSEAPWIKNWGLARAWLGDSAGTEVTQVEAKLFASGIWEELQERGLTHDKLGVVGFDGPANGALSELGITLVGARPIMQEMRAVKTEDEVNCMKTVAAIVEAGWYKVWETLRPGIRDTDLLTIAIDACYKAGADFVPPFCLRSGPITFRRAFGNTGRLIQTGDLVYMSMCGASYMGYHSCTYRTLIAGRGPNQKERESYQRLVERVNAVIDAIRPGATTADAAQHFMPATTEGYQEEAEVLTLEIGHGVGLAQYEPPIINRQWSLEYPQVFEPGMVIAVESMEPVESGVGGVRLENMVVVTEKGAEIIDHMPREQIWPPKFGF